jgi:hypothetical protein
MNSTTTLPHKLKLPTLQHWLRRDALAIFLFLLITILMTYPVAFKLGGDWIALRDKDTYMKLWDQWWFGHALQTGLPLNFSHTLFYPNGVDLTFHSISWTVVALSWLLTPLLSPIGAYNFTIVFAVFTTAYGGYLLIRSLVNHRAAAWLGGAVYSFIPYHIAHTGGHPDLVHLATIPLAVLLLIRACSRFSKKAAMGAGLMLGLAAWTSLYIMTFAFITIIPIFIYLSFEHRRWRTLKYWQVTSVVAIVGAVLVGARIWPIFQSPDALSTAIEQKYVANEAQADLLSFVTPSRLNPIFAPGTSSLNDRIFTDESLPKTLDSKWPAYLGIIPILLCLSLIGWRQQRGWIITWSALGLFFVILSLGPILRFNGVVYPNITLPAAYLQWAPPIRAVRPDFFVMGLSLPLAVCAAFGLERWLTALNGHRRVQIAVTTCLCILVLIEYWNGPFPGRPAQVSQFYAQLTQTPDQSAVIDLPMGRSESKMYLYLQTVHQHPILEGLVARTPPEAYEYINNNPLLSAWLNDMPLDCQKLSGSAISQALHQLMADNFRDVVVHNSQGEVPYQFDGYLTSQPIYADASITVYAIADLQAQPPCKSQ